jgi:hypothetical protein
MNAYGFDFSQKYGESEHRERPGGKPLATYASRIVDLPRRWTSTQEDPIGLAGGVNLYGFAGDDRVNGSDPFGLLLQSRRWVALLACSPARRIRSVA